jgi:hypothetical protein
LDGLENDAIEPKLRINDQSDGETSTEMPWNVRDPWQKLLANRDEK